MSDKTAPLWLWRTVRGGFLLLLAVIAGLAIALSRGAADPRPIGTLQWETNFDLGADPHPWQMASSSGTTADFGPYGVRFTLPARDASGTLTRPTTASRFTFEVAGAQVAGQSGARYGLVFDYLDKRNYSAVVLNNNGYLTAYREQDGHCCQANQSCRWPSCSR